MENVFFAVAEAAADLSFQDVADDEGLAVAVGRGLAAGGIAHDQRKGSSSDFSWDSCLRQEVSIQSLFDAKRRVGKSRFSLNYDFMSRRLICNRRRLDTVAIAIAIAIVSATARLAPSEEHLTNQTTTFQVVVK